LNSYTGLHAALYDEIFAEKPYGEEARFVHELVGAPGGTLLDVACGTGRHAAAFAELGYTVTATDFNDELLAVGRAAVGDRVRFVRGDMRDLAIDGGPFDVVTCLFDSIGYAGDNVAVVETLRSLGRVSAPGGSIAVEFLHAAAILRGAEMTRVRRVHLQDGRSLLRISETRLDVERMSMDVRYELVALGADGSVERSDEAQTNRFFSVPEITSLAHAAGLQPRTVVPAYETGLIDIDTFHLMLVAQPRP
jgi:SAM-dependent methyltransferase